MASPLQFTPLTLLLALPLRRNNFFCGFPKNTKKGFLVVIPLRGEGWVKPPEPLRKKPIKKNYLKPHEPLSSRGGRGGGYPGPTTKKTSFYMCIP